MQITFTPTRQDFVDTMQANLWRRYSPGMLKLRRFVDPLLGVGLVYFGIIAVVRWHTASGYFFLLLGVYFGLGSRIFVPMLYRRAFRRLHTGDPSPVTYEITESEIHCVALGKSDSHIEWAMIRGYIENSKVVLLYTAPAMFLGIPKRVMSEETLQELRLLLHHKQVAASFPK